MQDGDGQEARLSLLGHKAPASAEKAHLPLPADAPLLSFKDVAAYLRMTPAAVRRLLDGRADGSDGELGDLLRSCLVRLSPRRRYILRDRFLSILREKSLAASDSSGGA